MSCSASAMNPAHGTPSPLLQHSSTCLRTWPAKYLLEDKLALVEQELPDFRWSESFQL